MEQQAGPGGMEAQCLIKLRGHLPKLGKIVPRDGREIVMLVMVSHIERDRIDRSVIAECLLIRIERVMLLNPARSYRMQADRKEKRTGQIPDPNPAAELENGETISRGRNKVRDRPGAPHCDRS